MVYPLEGELPLSAPRLSFLLDDLPLAAKLLTHYQKTRYTAEMLGSNRFRAGRGSGLSADAYLISGGTGERLLYYLGSGVSHIGPWKLRGQALLRVEYWPTGNGLGYRVRVVSSPSNAFLNTIMNLGLFKAVLRKRVREVLEDITEASRKLQRDGGRSVANRTDWTPQEKERITTLLRLP